MQRDSPPPATDRILFSSASGAVGAFRLRPDHPRFSDSGPIEAQIVVFPRTSVEIRHEGSRPFVADACVASIYNRGQRYRRAAVDPAGDRCDWFALVPEIALELAARLDPEVGEQPEAPYRFEFTPVASALYLRQRRLFDRLARGGLETLEVEEELIGVVDEALAGAYRLRGARRRPASAPTGRERSAARDLAERAAALLGLDLDRSLALADLATRLGVTAPHLCRTFRRTRGATLHAHRTELRLRRAIELLRGSRRELTEIALACGFSSHSHFTNTFRKRFGLAPSRARET